LKTDEVIALEMVEKLNEALFSKNDLDEASYYVKSGYGQSTVEAINSESKKKFPSKSFGDLKMDLGLTDIISYAYFLKEVEYETIFEKGDPGSGMYIIRSGKVLIFNRNIHDQEQEMAVLGSGELFGETALSSPAPRTFSARTAEATELIGMYRSDLLTTTSKHPAIACRILLGLAKLISDQSQRATIELTALQQRIIKQEQKQQPGTGSSQ
jgi:CRP-like cAMP-binding protein